MMCRPGLAALMLAAAPLAAQQPQMMGHEQQDHMRQMEQIMAPMMRAMAFTPDHLLARKDSLNLTPQQVTRLTALRDAAQSTHDAAAAEAKAHMDGVGQAQCPGTYLGGTYPGTTDTRTFSFTAPSAPGRYYLRYTLALQFTCGAATGGTPVGELIVQTCRFTAEGVTSNRLLLLEAPTRLMRRS